MRFSESFRWTMVALMLFASGCVGPDGSFHDSEGNILKGTPAEVRQAQQTLLAINSEAGMRADMKGGVLFDGKIEAISSGPEGSSIATVKVEHVIAGPFGEGDQVRIQTPSLATGGVRFAYGRRFRVFAVELDGQLRTWSLAGTVELSDSAGP